MGQPYQPPECRPPPPRRPPPVVSAPWMKAGSAKTDESPLVQQPRPSPGSITRLLSSHSTTSATPLVDAALQKSEKLLELAGHSLWSDAKQQLSYSISASGSPARSPADSPTSADDSANSLVSPQASWEELDWSRTPVDACHMELERLAMTVDMLRKCLHGCSQSFPALPDSSRPPPAEPEPPCCDQCSPARSPLGGTVELPLTVVEELWKCLCNVEEVVGQDPCKGVHTVKQFSDCWSSDASSAATIRLPEQLVRELRNCLDDLEDGEHTWLAACLENTVSTGFTTDRSSAGLCSALSSSPPGSLLSRSSATSSTRSRSVARSRCTKLSEDDAEAFSGQDAASGRARAPLAMDGAVHDRGIPICGGSSRSSPLLHPRVISASHSVLPLASVRDARSRVSPPRRSASFNSKVPRLATSCSVSHTGITSFGQLKEPLAPTGSVGLLPRSLTPRRLVRRPVAITSLYSVLSWE